MIEWRCRELLTGGDGACEAIGWSYEEVAKSHSSPPLLFFPFAFYTHHHMHDSVPQAEAVVEALQHNLTLSYLGFDFMLSVMCLSIAVTHSQMRFDSQFREAPDWIENKLQTNAVVFPIVCSLDVEVNVP